MNAQKTDVPEKTEKFNIQAAPTPAVIAALIASLPVAHADVVRRMAFRIDYMTAYIEEALRVLGNYDPDDALRDKSSIVKLLN